MIGTESIHMTTTVNRREFILQSASIAVAGTFLGGAEPRRCVAADRIKKAACIGVLPEGMTVLQRFETAKMAGFEGIEPNTLYAPDEVRQYREAAEKTGIRIHSIMNSDHWKYPLTDNDPEVVKKCIEGMQTSMRNAHELGAHAVLLAPADCLLPSERSPSPPSLLLGPANCTFMCNNVQYGSSRRPIP